jgi:hypothetical protein
MSAVIDGVREKFPQYKDVPDEDLAIRIGEKYPQYMDKDPDFKKEVIDAHTKKATALAKTQKDIADTALSMTETGLAAGSEMTRKEQLAEGDKAFQKAIGQQDQPPKDALHRAMKNWQEAGMATGTSDKPVVHEFGGTTITFPPPGTLGLPTFRPPEEAGVVEKVAAGLYNTGVSIPNFAMTPMGVATMIAPELLPAKYAVPLLKGIFAGLMAKTAGEAAGTASVTKDPQDITEAVGAAVFAGHLSYTGAIESINQRRKVLGKPEIPPPIRTLIKTLINKIAVEGPGAKALNAEKALAEEAKKASSVAPMTAQALAGQPAALPTGKDLPTPKGAEPPGKAENVNFKMEGAEDTSTRDILTPEKKVEETPQKPSDEKKAPETAPKEEKPSTEPAATPAEAKTPTGGTAFVTENDDGTFTVSDTHGGPDLGPFKTEEEANKAKDDYALHEEAGKSIQNVQQPGGAEEGADALPADETGKEAGKGSGGVPQEAPALEPPRKPRVIQKEIGKQERELARLEKVQKNLKKSKTSTKNTDKKVEAARQALDILRGELSRAQAEAPKKPKSGEAGSPMMKRFDAETQRGGPDILSWMVENMKMLSRKGAKAYRGEEWWNENKSQWDDIPKALSAIHHHLIYDDKGSPPNKVAQQAFEAGQIKEPSESALGAAIEAASKKRAGKGHIAEAKAIEAGAAFEDAVGEGPGKTLVAINDVGVGAKLTIAGKELRVKSIDQDAGEVVLNDGTRIADDRTIWVEKYEPASESDFGFPEEEAEAAPEPQAAPEPKAETPKPEAPKPNAQPKVQPRDLTKAEQSEFQALSIKARRNRELGEAPLTSEETQRYEHLTSLAGQMDLLGEDKASGFASRIKILKEKVEQMDRLREKTEERAWTSKHRREELLKEAVTYAKEAEKARDEIRELERQLKGEKKQQAQEQDFFAETPTEKEEHKENFELGLDDLKEQNPGLEDPDKAQHAIVQAAVDANLPVDPEVAKEAGVEVPPAPEKPSDKKFRIGTSPQTYTLIEKLKQSEMEKDLGEQPVRVKNDKTGVEEIVLESQLEEVRTRTKEEREASKGLSKKDLDEELLRLGLEPDEFKTMAEKRAAIKRQKQKGHGPGSPAISQGPDPKPEIQQLEESMRNIQGKKVSIKDRLREMWATSQKRASATGNQVAQAWTGFKYAKTLLTRQYMQYGLLNNFTNLKGRLSSTIEIRGWLSRRFANTVRKSIPSTRERAAITKWVDAGGDVARLNQGFQEAPAAYKQAYLDALNLSPDAKIAAQNIQNYFEAQLQEAIDNGVLKDGVEDYIHRIFEKDPKLAQSMQGFVSAGLLKTNAKIAMKRIFAMDWEAEKLGFKVVQDFIPRITEYERSLSTALAARDFVRRVAGGEDPLTNKKVSPLRASDGRPVVSIRGLGLPVTDPSGIRTATVIKPHAIPGKMNDQKLYPAQYRGDYVERPEYAAFRNWKWMGEDAAGQPIYLQGDIAIHPEYIEKFDNLLQSSRLRYARNPYIRNGARFALGLSGAFKQTMLDFSGFHMVQIGVHGAEHRVWVLPGKAPSIKLFGKTYGFTKIMKDIDFEDRDTIGLLRGGVTLGGEYHAGDVSEGLAGRSISRLIPGVAEAMETYHNWLFQSYIPRLKMTMAQEAFKRNMEAFKPDLLSRKMSRADIYNMTAKQANAAFGELNYVMMERSKTARDLARLFFLAPDFFEARAQFVGQALQRGGGNVKDPNYWKRGGPLTSNEQRMALLFGAMTMYATARAANLMINGQAHMEPENAFSVIYKNKSYSLRTVQGDILHALTKPTQFITSRLNPVFGRAVMEWATGRDYFGRKRSGLEQLYDFVSTAMPITLRSNSERKHWESFLNGFGINARRYVDFEDAYKFAEQWKRKHHEGGKGDFVYDADKDALRTLNVTLSNDDEYGAMKAIDKLLKGKGIPLPDRLDTPEKRLIYLRDHYNRMANSPFTGSQDNDRRFMEELSEDQKITVRAAMQHKKAMRDLFQNALEKYNAAQRGEQ